MGSDRPQKPCWQQATLYGVGVGPGDPEAMSLKAVRVLRTVPAILVPHSVNRASVALGIIRRWIRPARQQLLMQPYPMMGSDTALEAARVEGANRAKAILATGTSLACVTEGDPMLYSTFLDVLERVGTALPEVRVEVIPGVSSMTACAAAAVWPLARRNEGMAILPAAEALDNLKDVLTQFETVVLVKVRSAFEDLVKRLDGLGFLDRAVLVEDCGRPCQRVTRDLGARYGTPLSYFSTVIVSRRCNPFPEGAVPHGAGVCEIE